jgi:hypothetical protein
VTPSEKAFQQGINLFSAIDEPGRPNVRLYDVIHPTMGFLPFVSRYASSQAQGDGIGYKPGMSIFPQIILYILFPYDYPSPETC